MSCSFYNALVMCIFSNPPAQDVVDLVAAATGCTTAGPRATSPSWT
jgi:hypothetical protein